MGEKQTFTTTYKTELDWTSINWPDIDPALFIDIRKEIEADFFAVVALISTQRLQGPYGILREGNMITAKWRKRSEKQDGI